MILNTDTDETPLPSSFNFDGIYIQGDRKILRLMRRGAQNAACGDCNLRTRK